MNEKEMCTYCAKWFPEDETKSIDDPRFKYCAKCYPVVYLAQIKLPWNKK